MFSKWLLAAACAACLNCSLAIAATIPIASVTCTGYFLETEAFPCANAIDGRTDDMDGSPDNWSFWLGRSYQDHEALVFDLTSDQMISGFTIYNTHNRQYDDRATNGFQIFVSSSPADPLNPADLPPENSATLN